MRKLLALTLVAWLSSAQADERSARLLNIELAKITSAQATFSQHVIDSKGNRGQEFTGEMSVKRPGLFRWDTRKPYPQTIVADGKKVWVYDPDLNQVIVQKMDKQVGNTPALLLSGDTRSMTGSFDIVEEPGEKGELSFLLTPLAKDALFEAMRIKFRNGVLAEMQLKDSLGQKTRIQFSGVKYNASIASSVFRFKPPKDADLINE